MIHLDHKTFGDLVCILQGQFDPLKTFMGLEDYRSVCRDMHLCSEEYPDHPFFPLPVTLTVPSDVQIGDTLYLYYQTIQVTSMEVTEVYAPDIDFECQHAYGTTDIHHPYVFYKQRHRYSLYATGTLEKPYHIPFEDFFQDRYTPQEVREIIRKQGWDTVVGFQTRNPMHRAHFELTQHALRAAQAESKGTPALLLSPTVGETQKCDVDYKTRVLCYKELLPLYENPVLLTLIPQTMRMAGPREACLHALIRKNYGCTHFVVGRDHAGPSYKDEHGNPFYEPYEAQNLVSQHAEELGVRPIFSGMIGYNLTKGIYQPTDEMDPNDTMIQLSGTKIRHCLHSGESIPFWFSFPRVIQILRRRYEDDVPK